jgi:hypothetical protein
VVGRRRRGLSGEDEAHARVQQRQQPEGLHREGRDGDAPPQADAARRPRRDEQDGSGERPPKLDRAERAEHLAADVEGDGAGQARGLELHRGLEEGDPVALIWLGMLLADLARWLVRLAPAEGASLAQAESTGREIGREFVAQAHDVAAPVAMRAALSALGFQPEMRPSPDGVVSFALGNCPYREAVRANQPLVCGLHRGITLKLLDRLAPGARLLAFGPLDPDTAGCRVEVEAGPAPRHGGVPRRDRGGAERGRVAGRALAAAAERAHGRGPEPRALRAARGDAGGAV